MDDNKKNSWVNWSLSIFIVISHNAFASPSDQQQNQHFNSGYTADSQANTQTIRENHFSNHQERQPPTLSSDAKANRLGMKLSLYSQTQKSHFDWSIAADLSGQRSPNTLSQLSYENLDVQSFMIRSHTFFQLSDTTVLHLGLENENGSVSSGQVLDSDFLGNNKTQVRSISQSNPSGSGIHSSKISLGFTHKIFPQTHVGLSLGLGTQSQKFIKRNGLQLYSDENSFTPAKGTLLTNLNSSYNTQWNSHFLGFNLVQLFGRQALSVQMEYHDSDYYAQANWNLRSAFQHPKSFEHIAHGNGVSTRIEYYIPLSKKWYVSLNAKHEVWQTNHGIDRLFFKDGRTPTTRLNETHWESIGYAVGMSYQL